MVLKLFDFKPWFKVLKIINQDSFSSSIKASIKTIYIEKNNGKMFSV